MPITFTVLINRLKEKVSEELHSLISFDNMHPSRVRFLYLRE